MFTAATDLLRIRHDCPREVRPPIEETDAALDALAEMIVQRTRVPASIAPRLGGYMGGRIASFAVRHVQRGDGETPTAVLAGWLQAIIDVRAQHCVFSLQHGYVREGVRWLENSGENSGEQRSFLMIST